MPRRVKYPDAEPNDIERLAVYERLVVSDLPFGIRGVHVDRSACLSAYRLQRIHVVGVAMRYQDRRHRCSGGAQDLLRLGTGVDDDVALRSVYHVGVDLEAVHRECDLLDLAHRRAS
jgi:predicted RNA methylase